MAICNTMYITGVLLRLLLKTLTKGSNLWTLTIKPHLMVVSKEDLSSMPFIQIYVNLLYVFLLLFCFWAFSLTLEGAIWEYIGCKIPCFFPQKIPCSNPCQWINESNIHLFQHTFLSFLFSFVAFMISTHHTIGISLYKVLFSMV